MRARPGDTATQEAEAWWSSKFIFKQSHFCKTHQTPYIKIALWFPQLTTGAIKKIWPDLATTPATCLLLPHLYMHTCQEAPLTIGKEIQGCHAKTHSELPSHSQPGHHHRHPEKDWKHPAPIHILDIHRHFRLTTLRYLGSVEPPPVSASMKTTLEHSHSSLWPPKQT